MGNSFKQWLLQDEANGHGGDRKKGIAWAMKSHVKPLKGKVTVSADSNKKAMGLVRRHFVNPII